MKLSSTAQRVLHNMHTGKPMWDGVVVVSPGAGVPSIVTMLRKRGLIRVDLLTDKFVLTPQGKEVAESYGEKRSK